MAIKKSGLGRGLDGLFPSYMKKDTEEEAPGKKNGKNTGEETKESSSEKSKTAAKRAGTKKTDSKPAEKKTAAKKTSSGKTAGADPDPEQKEVVTERKTAADLEEMHQDAADAPDTTQKEEKIPENETGIRMLRVSDIEPNTDQPRKTFNEDALEELAESFKLHGVVQPLIVVKRGEYYMIVAGERRWRAAKIAGLKEVPVLVADYSDREVMEISLIENIQREDLEPIEEAQAFRRLIDEFGLKQDEVAERVSRSRTAVTNSLRLLKLDPRVQQMVIEDKISAGHARALLAIEISEEQYLLAMKVFDERLSVRETERLVKLHTQKKPERKKAAEDHRLDYIYEDMEAQLRAALGTKVILNRKTPQKGKIEIEYYSSEELERLYDLLRILKQN